MVWLKISVIFSCLWSVTCSSDLPFFTFVSHDFATDPLTFHGGVGDEARSFLQVEASSLKLNTTGSTGEALAAKGKAEQKLAPKTWFAITISTALVVKTLCMTSNVIYQVSPYPAVKDFYNKGNTGQTDAAPYMGIFFGGFQWCFYGIYAYVVTEKSGFLVLVYSNVLGPVMGSCYVLGFWRNCQDIAAVHRLYMYAAFACALLLMQVCAMCTLPCQQSLFFSGFVSSVCSVMMSVSMLATVPIVLETRCSASINVTVTIVGIVSAMLWVTCGCILKDKWIVVPNSTGLIILLFTLSLAVHFPQDPVAAKAAVKAAAQTALLSAAGAKAKKLEDDGEDSPIAMRSALIKGGGYLDYGAATQHSSPKPSPKSSPMPSPLSSPKICYSGDMGGTM